jgi:hypothetical protein
MNPTILMEAYTNIWPETLTKTNFQHAKIEIGIQIHVFSGYMFILKPIKMCGSLPLV